MEDIDRIVSVTTPTFDLDAGLRLRLLDDGNLGNLTRRATVTPTLDGGVVVDNMGVFDSDRNLALRAEVDTVTFPRIQRLHQNNPVLYLSTSQGFFSAVSLTITLVSGIVTWVFQVTGRLDSA